MIAVPEPSWEVDLTDTEIRDLVFVCRLGASRSKREIRRMEKRRAEGAPGDHDHWLAVHRDERARYNALEAKLEAIG